MSQKDQVCFSLDKWKVTHFVLNKLWQIRISLDLQLMLTVSFIPKQCDNYLIFQT